MMAAVAAAGLLVVGQTDVRAAGQPQCETGPTAGAAPGQEHGAKSEQMAQANVEAKKQADPDKYREAGANTANQACPDAAPSTGSSSQK